MNTITPDKQTSAVCGLLCKSCTIYIATKENNTELLSKIAERLQLSLEETQCKGCRSNVLSSHCKTCFFRECAENKNIEFCSECNEYQCSKLKEFQLKMPHRVDLFQSLDRIKEIGREKWYIEIFERHSCTECGEINGWYELVCRHCGNEPSSAFVADNFEILSSRKI